MTSAREDLLELTAGQIADAVRSGALAPTDAVTWSLERIDALDGRIGAFQVVRADKASAEARALAARDDLSQLPLAGVPIAIKDNIDVAGEPTRYGSRATPDTTAVRDHELVRRLRSAGAIVVGKTRVPEFCMWGWTDSAFGVTRSPWDLQRTSGGSSGGSAAAVAAGMVPLAQGSDGGGSIRIPAACCGIFGIKPGTGLLPREQHNWYGLSEMGPLATTVDDAALALSILSGRLDLARPVPPPGPLRIAVSVKPSFLGAAAKPDYAAAVRNIGDALAREGHIVSEADPAYGADAMLSAAARVFAGVAQNTASLRLSALERRSRTQVLLGRMIRRTGLLRAAGGNHWKKSASQFFSNYDVLITPTLAAPPIPAEGWCEKGFLANVAVASFSPFTAPWNAAGYPAAAVPVTGSPGSFPLSVQLVAPMGGEGLLLSLAKQLESVSPWQRHADPETFRP